MKQFTRDSTIRLKFNFKNAFGEILNPIGGAEVSLSYVPHGGGDPTTTTYTLVQSGDDWIYEWDSSIASPCVITAHAQTNDGPPTSSIDAEFRLKANRANRELTGDW
jgi:hypothetical protein